MDLLKPATLKALCARAGMRPEKSSGQHFLISRAALDRIVAAVDPRGADTILEVGAGFGVLTCALAPHVARVIAIERDRRIAAVLREIVSGKIPRSARNDEEDELVAEYGNVEVVEEDVLRWLRGDHAICVIARSRRSEKPTAWLRTLRDGIGDAEERGHRALCMAKQFRSMCAKGGIASVAPLPRNDTTHPWKLAANLPYSITSDFLRLFFDCVADGSLTPPERAVLLLQREVVDRLTANPERPRDRANAGLLTILTALHCAPRRVATVPPGAFWPPPKVDSAVIALEGWRTPEQIAALLGDVPRDAFLRFVRHCFGQRRRQLGAITRAPHPTFHALGIEPTARPETLTLAQWIALIRVLRDSEHAHR